jgi:hypothetical protein
MFSIPIRVDRNARIIEAETEGGLTDRSNALQNRLRFLREEGQPLEEKFDQSLRKTYRDLLSTAKKNEVSSYKKLGMTQQLNESYDSDAKCFADVNNTLNSALSIKRFDHNCGKEGDSD